MSCTIKATRIVDIFDFFLATPDIRLVDSKNPNPYCMRALAGAINRKLILTQGADINEFFVYFSVGMDRLYLEHKWGSDKLVRIVDPFVTVDELKKKWPNDAVTIIGEITDLNLMEISMNS